MSEEIEFTVKAEANITEIKFKKEADELLSMLGEFKKLERKMKQYEANVKAYMIENDMKFYENATGEITVTHSTRWALDRAKIPDIQQYYDDITCCTMRKSLKPKKKN